MFGKVPQSLAMSSSGKGTLMTIMVIKHRLGRPNPNMSCETYYLTDSEQAKQEAKEYVAKQVKLDKESGYKDLTYYVVQILDETSTGD
jgi:hypothetical protein